MVPNVRISHEDLINVIDYNKETGEFSWRNPNWRHAKYSRDIGSIDNKGRRYININRKSYASHRLAWFYVTKEWPSWNVVAKNGDYLDLRFDNLDLESPSRTALRAKPKSNTYSGLRGVSWDITRNKWIATIRIGKKQSTIGRYNTKEEASVAYEKQKKLKLAMAPSSQEIADFEAVKEKNRTEARYKSLWRRIHRAHGGLTGWPSFELFREEMDGQLRDFMDLVAIDNDSPIGPKNWKWDETLYSAFDTSTKEGRNAYERAVRRRNPWIKRDRDLRKNFSIGVADYYKMLDRCNGLCEACGNPETEKRSGETKWLAVDHCHVSGHIRGLLCAACNKAIGQFKDDPARLRAAADYLERCAEKIKLNGAASHPLEDSTKGARSAS